MTALLQVEQKTYPVEACLLDKDGTVLSSHHWVEVMRMRASHLARALGLDAEQHQALLCFVTQEAHESPSASVAITALPRDQAEAAVAGYLQQLAGVSPGQAWAAVHETFARVDEVFPFAEHLRPTPGAESFLREVWGIGLKTALVTHDSQAAARRHIEALGWTDLVHTIVGVDDMENRKPNPDGVLLACRALGVPPSRCLMSGDTAADIGAGRAAGCRPIIGLLSGMGDAAELAGADHIVPDLTALSFSKGNP